METATECPVCGMIIDQNTAFATTYDEQEYHLCSDGCLKKFDADPTRYVVPTGS